MRGWREENDVRCDCGVRDWGDDATSQRILAVSRSWRSQGMNFPLEPPEENSPANIYNSDTAVRE
jgi:hypothetical protein